MTGGLERGKGAGEEQMYSGAEVADKGAPELEERWMFRGMLIGKFGYYESNNGIIRLYEYCIGFVQLVFCFLLEEAL